MELNYIYGPGGEKLEERVTLAAPPITPFSLPLGGSVEMVLPPGGDIVLSGFDISLVNTTRYCGPFVIRYGMLDKFLFDGGYYNFVSPGDFHYYLRDHLGSNRVVVSEGGVAEQVTHYYPLGGVMGDISTSAGLQPWKFSGKEEVSHGGLNLFDFGARLYDPALGVWTSTDPHAEDYYDVSHHAYCADNFVNAIDPDGRIWVDINGKTITDHSQIKCYIFYDPNSFFTQSFSMAKDLETQYGEGCVALSDASTIDEFAQDWENMSSMDIKEVELNYHGNNQTLILDSDNVQYLTATGDGKTNKDKNPAMNVQDLNKPKGNVSMAQLNINSCYSNKKSSNLSGNGQTLMESFANTTDFNIVRGTSVGVSYNRITHWPIPQRYRTYKWEYIIKKRQRQKQDHKDIIIPLYYKTGGMK